MGTLSLKTLEVLGRGGLPSHVVAETWAVSDVDGEQGIIRNGPLAGATLRDLVRDHPVGLMGEGWSGNHSPLLTTFIDASGMLPVHLHANDDARTLEGEANGKTETWHILGGPRCYGALRRPAGRVPGGVEGCLRKAGRRRPAAAPCGSGQTLHVPGGTPHSFGPDTVVHEIGQSSNPQQHAMPWRMEDGSVMYDEERASIMDLFLQECSLDERPRITPGLGLQVEEGVQRTFLAAGPHSVLERWTAEAGTPIRHAFRTALVVSNTAAP